jgi:hypothetical protein
MVLSDSDLTALVDWTRARLDLQRHRHGWGVVCGLDVRCDPDHPGGVVVLPGYAVGCCGEDIVLCDLEKVDLTACCGTDSPCASPDDPRTKGTRTQDSTTKDTGTQDGTSTDQRQPCGDVVVDLSLRPAEAPTIPGLIATCGCGGRDASGCGCGSGDAHDSSGRLVPTRIREGGTVATRRVAFADADQTSAAAERARERYAECHAVVTRLAELNVKFQGRADDLVEWLGQQKLDPPCRWWPRLCADLDAGGKDKTESILVEAMFELVADCRNRILRRQCSTCETDEVGLARVWLTRVEDAQGRPTCEVRHIDAYPPFRREAPGPSTRSLPAGAEDLTPYIWQRWDQVCARWRMLAADAPPSVRAMPASLTELAALFEETTTLWWSCDDGAPTPVVVDTQCLGRRVVGFGPRSEGWRHDVMRTRDSSHELEASPDAGSAGGPVEAEPAPALSSELEDVARITPARAGKLRAATISSVEELSMATDEQLAAILRGTPKATIQVILADARRIVESGG